MDGNNGILAFTINGPKLSISPASGAKVVCSWGLFTGFTLQATPSLTPIVNWTNIGPGTVLNGQYVQTNSTGPTMLYYRLQK